MMRPNYRSRSRPKQAVKKQAVKKKVAKKKVAKKVATSHVTVTESTVVNQPGHPVAATCTITHCQWFDQERRITQLEQDGQEADQLRDRLASLLNDAAIALNGPEPDDVKWSFHDVPEKIVVLNETIESARAEIQRLVGKMHFLLEWVDRQGLLEEHVFTFPDGDIWEAPHADAR